LCLVEQKEMAGASMRSSHRAEWSVEAPPTAAAGQTLNSPATSAALSWSRCEAALAGSKVTVAAADAAGRFTWVFNRAPGLPGLAVGRTEAEVFPPEQAKAIAAARLAAISSGSAQHLELSFPDGQAPHWYEVSVRPHREGGKLAGTVAAFIDVSDRKIQEEHLRIVLRELAHRSKNLLAVIQGIARQTASGAASVQQFVSRFNGRIFSLSRAHDVLTEADWRGARIFDLVRSQVALYAENRLPAIVVEGENGFLRPNAAQYVGLALHELTTNAVKYGALSRPDGVVVVRFEPTGGGATYRFTWTEKSGAQPREPSVRSFGLIMLNEVIPTAVSGRAELSFAPDGLTYALEIPKAQLLA
jgi:two-component sensor histidine kinase